MRNLLSDSTGIVQKSCNLTNHALEKELATSLDCFNVSAQENRQLSFLESIIPGGLTVNDPANMLMKENHSIFDMTGFADEPIGSPMDFKNDDMMEPTSPVAPAANLSFTAIDHTNEQINELYKRFETLMNGQQRVNQIQETIRQDSAANLNTE